MLQRNTTNTRLIRFDKFVNIDISQLLSESKAMFESNLVIFWCRRDFRLLDNPALFEAIRFAKERNFAFLPVFILEKEIFDEPKNNLGYPEKYFLAKILAEFTVQFPTFAIFKKGSSESIFESLSQNFKLHVFANLDIEPKSIFRDKQVKKVLDKAGSSLTLYRDQLTIDPKTISGTGNVYSVFTPFRNTVLNQFIEAKVYPESDLDQLKFLTAFNLIQTSSGCFKAGQNYLESSKIFDQVFKEIDTPWQLFLEKHTELNQYFELDLDQILSRPDLSNWYFTEQEALQNTDVFIAQKILKYKPDRDFMELDLLQSGATSRLSPALKWGLVSARIIKQKILAKFDDYMGNEAVFCYISELIWREFYKYILYHNPKVLNQEFQPKYRNNALWVNDELALSRFNSWIKGQTGYPLVDASMQQLKTTGWMHNRSRMVVASILTKNLGVDWRWGQDYFRATLVDLDEASNNGGWQWSASTGADPKPIRIFNPYLQAQNYDPNGRYTQLWLPPQYSQNPIIEHKLARQEALDRYTLAQDIFKKTNI